jgi:Flp pilus assembly protein TadG
MRRITSRRGAQAVEFALTAPILLLLLAGIIDLGQYMYVADGVVNAVAQGGRLGALADPGKSQNPVTTATNMAQASWAASDLDGTLTVTASNSGVDPDIMIVVVGTAPFNAYFGFLNLPTQVSYTHTVRRMYQQ